MKTKSQEQAIRKRQGGFNLFNRFTHGTNAEHVLDEGHFNENQYCGGLQPNKHPLLREINGDLDFPNQMVSGTS